MSEWWQGYWTGALVVSFLGPVFAIGVNAVVYRWRSGRWPR